VLVERLIADHEIDWVNTLFLSMRFDAHRAGTYNEFLYTFFKCLIDERLEYAEGWFAERRDDDSETVLDGWAMQARCPHLKAELAHFGVVEGTTLTCRMHGWQWDLTSGKCLTSRGHELRCHWAGEGDPPSAADTGTRVRITQASGGTTAGAGDEIPDLDA
jgi:UDP-MurNAc hydroxylase